MKFCAPVMILLLLSAPAFAKMAAMRQVPAESVVKYLENQKKTRALGPLEKNTLELAKLGRELGAKISRPYTENEAQDLPNIGAAEVAASLHGAIPADWAQSPSPKALKLLRKNRKLLESYLGARSGYDWAWVQYELGEKEPAKQSLRNLFDLEYAKVMKMEKAVSVFGRTPLTDAELYYQALKPMSSADDAKELDDKLQKMKVHLSNIPQSRIMT